MKNLFFAVFFVFIFFCSCQRENSMGSSSSQEMNIIPLPVKHTFINKAFILDKQTEMIANENLSFEAKYLKKNILETTGFGVEIHQQKENKQNTIQLLLSDSINHSEAYYLSVDENNVIIKAKNSAGIFYGIQSLLQLFSFEKQKYILPGVEIYDYPRFSWRGMHLDVSRHFFSVEFIKKYIDFLAAYKLNVFHWHLTDDQGWRIEIKKYPELTRKGAWRLDTGDKWDYEPKPAQKGKPRYGGFYTQDEVKEVVEYAQKRNVTILPEIEMPGHSWAALYAYPELSCTGIPWTLAEEKNFEFSDPYCAGNEKTFEFLEDVLTEVIHLFPSEYIHIGGDECKKTPWKKCPKCQERMREENLDNVEELQSYFIRRISKFVTQKGRKIIGWDEILEGGLAPEAAVMSWRGFDGGIEAALQSHNVVMAPSDFVYFNRAQGIPEFEPGSSKLVLTLEKVYNFEPLPRKLPADKTKFIMGAQACLWTEYISTTDRVEYMIFPRLLALSEVLWTHQEKKDYNHFKKRMAPHLGRLQNKGINYRIPTPEGLSGTHVFYKDTTVTIKKPFKGNESEIRYTLNGTDPDKESHLYSKPIKIHQSTILRARTFLPDGSKSNVARAYFFNIDPEKNGLKCDYFEGKWEKMPDFNNPPARTKHVYKVNTDVIEHRDDYFALRFSGYLEIEKRGLYTFFTESDDGSQLVINNEMVVDNDGIHGAEMKTGKIMLDKGRHLIQIKYFEATIGEILEIGTVSPAGEKKALDLSKIFVEE